MAKKKDLKQDAIRMLHLEIDYHLLTLHEAMEKGRKREIRKQTTILKEKHEALTTLGARFRSRGI